MKLNPSQKLAVDTIDKNLALLSGAGTGKTKVLTDRYINILDKGEFEREEELESILAISFTEKASSEMKDRIKDAIRKKAVSSKNWEELYLDIEKANISTMHKFSKDIILENYLQLGLDGDIKLLEEGESQILLEQAIEKSIDKLASENEIFNGFLIEKKLLFNRSIVESLDKVYKKLRSEGKNLDWLEKLTIQNINEKSVLSLERLDFVKEEFKFFMDKAKKNTRFYKIRNKPQLVEFLEGDNNKNIFTNLRELKGHISSWKEYEARIENLTKELDELLLAGEIEYIEYYRVILKLLNYVDKFYTREKEKINSLDFDDLLIITNKLLDDKNILEKYRKRFKYIMVDEFQDTNQLQKEIIYKLASQENKLDRDNLFIVGDEKQSIYGFRGGDLDVFQEVVEDIQLRDESAKIHMNQNYRTSQEILDFINDSFDPIISSYKALIGSFRTEDKNSIQIVEVSAEDDEDIKELEAREIANLIADLIEEGYQYKDIGILTRNRTYNSYIERELNGFKIPFLDHSKKALMEKREILDLVYGFLAILNLDNKLYNLAFLKSPIIGLDDKDIYILAKDNKSIYESLSEEENYREVFALYKNLINIKEKYIGREFIYKFIDLIRYKEVLLLEEDYFVKRANLEKFLEIIVKDFPSVYTSHDQLYEYLLKLNKRGDGEVDIVDSELNMVNLMTIHQAKGLEFKIVILPFLNIYKNSRRSQLIEYDKEIGLAINMNEEGPRNLIIKNKEMKREAEEEIRVLYVGLTRAKEKLIIGISKEKRDSYYRKLLGDNLNNLPRYKSKTLRFIKEKDLEASEKIEFIVKDEEKKDRIKLYNDYLSASQYMVYRKSWQEYENIYKYREIELDREKEIKGELGLDPIVRGNIIHKFAARYRKGLDIDLLIREVTRSYEIDYELFRGELDLYLNNYLDFFEKIKGEVFFEKEFYLLIKGFKFKGFIDIIYKKGKDIYVVDLKTNKVENIEKLIEEYKDQVFLYMEAVKRAYPDYNVFGKILFLESNQEVVFTYSDIDLEGIIEFAKSVGS